MEHHISPPKGLLCPLAEQELLQVQPLPAVDKDLKFLQLWTMDELCVGKVGETVLWHSAKKFPCQDPTT